MKKRLVTVLLMFVFTPAAFAGSYSGGNGSAEYPYRIDTPADLDEIGLTPADWDANFVMVNDIDLSSFSAAEFSIIGIYPTDPFTGIFDGNDRTISNFNYEVTGVHQIGLFSYIDSNDALIKNLTLSNPSVTASTSDYVGSLVGMFEQGSLLNCLCLGGSVTADDQAGGLAGRAGDNTIISNCSSDTSVNGDFNIAGLVGENRGLISKCLSSADVSGNTSVGGIAGINNGSVSRCFAIGTPSGLFNVGGLVGNDLMIVSDSFTAGTVTGSNRVGGLIGRQSSFDISEKTENCYSVAIVDCSGTSTGALIGFENNPDSTFIACFWSSTINPDLNGIGNASEPNVIGIPADEMRDKNTFLDAGWDFTGETNNGSEDIWSIQPNQSYPFLNLSLPADISGDGIVNFYDLNILAQNWLKTTE
ncbi:MAG: GLUG motif-containing protein [Planctomycetota bacterium]|jgi:hypothetical protein